MELAGFPRLDEEGGGCLVGVEAQTTWWTPFLSRQLLHLQRHAKVVKPQCNRQTDGWVETPANKEAMPAEQA